MTSIYMNPVCRGSWALGSACGKCERCVETNPHKPEKMTTNNEAFEVWFSNKLAECRANNDMDMHRNLSRYVGFYKFGFEAATTEANKRMAELIADNAKLRSKLSEITLGE